MMNSVEEKSWKTNKIHTVNKIIPGIEIFSDKKCQVAFGFEYIYSKRLPFFEISYQKLKEH